MCFVSSAGKTLALRVGYTYSRRSPFVSILCWFILEMSQSDGWAGTFTCCAGVPDRRGRDLSWVAQWWQDLPRASLQCTFLKVWSQPVWAWAAGRMGIHIPIWQCGPMLSVFHWICLPDAPISKQLLSLSNSAWWPETEFPSFLSSFPPES